MHWLISSDRVVTVEIWGLLGRMESFTESESVQLRHRSMPNGIHGGVKDHGSSFPLSKPKLKLLICESDLDLPLVGVKKKGGTGGIPKQRGSDHETVRRRASWDNSTSTSFIFPTLKSIGPTIISEDKQIPGCQVCNTVPKKPHLEEQQGRRRSSSTDGNLISVYCLDDLDDLYKRSVRHLGTKKRIKDGISTPLVEDSFAVFEDHTHPDHDIPLSPVIKNAIARWQTQYQTPSVTISGARSEITLAPTSVTRNTGLKASVEMSRVTATNNPRGHTLSRPAMLLPSMKDTWTNPKTQTTRHERRSLSPFGAITKKQYSMVVSNKKWGSGSHIGIDTYDGDPIPHPPDFLRTRSDGDHLSNRQQLQSRRPNEETLDVSVLVNMIHIQTTSLAGAKQNDKSKPFTRGRSSRGKSADLFINDNTIETNTQNSYLKELKEEFTVPSRLNRQNTGRVRPFSRSPIPRSIKQESSKNMDHGDCDDDGHMKKLSLGRRLGLFTSRRFRDDHPVDRTSPRLHTTSESVPFVESGIEAFYHQNTKGVVECVQLTSCGQVTTCSFIDANIFVEFIEPISSILS